MNKKGESTLKICDQKLKYLNYSNTTRSIYLNYIKSFLLKQEKSPLHLNSKDFQSYLNYYNFSSISQQNQIINSIRFLYKEVLKKKYNKVSFKRPKKERKLPQPISSEILKPKIESVSNLKHRSILSLAYSVGLRVGEVINLKISDIDSKRMLIRVEQGKGKRDRYVPLSNKILKLLRLYFSEFKPKEYLFNGQKSLQYSTSSCNNIMKNYIGEKYHFHQLRHSCFTTLHESGVSLRDIQVLAGHESSKTTEVYSKVSNKHLKTLPLPL